MTSNTRIVQIDSEQTCVWAALPRGSALSARADPRARNYLFQLGLRIAQISSSRCFELLRFILADVILARGQVLE